MEVDWSRRPIAEHYASLKGFSLISSLDKKGVFVNLIAVVAGFTEIKSSRGTDMTRALIVCDPSAAMDTTGLLVQFYRPSADQLPRPTDGSIIILKAFKTFDYHGVVQAWSNHQQSQWIIYDANGSRILSQTERNASIPTPDVQAYVKRLADWWKTRSGKTASTEIAVPSNLNSALSHSTGRSTVTLKEVREGKFYDVYAYVVKTYPSRENAFTLYLTDYTTNPQFHDYVYGETPWVGPFGQQTIQVTLWDAHAYYAQAHVHEDHYVFLRNLQGKRADSGRLEGAVRGDRSNPSKVNVILIQPGDPRVKAIKLRRTQYETTWKINKEKLDEEIVMQQQAEKVLQLTPPTSVNPNLRTSYPQIPLTPVGDILEPPYVPQVERVEGPGGRKRPRKYRTVGRIIDFWPPDLRDFSRPFCMSCQATYVPSHPERRSVSTTSAATGTSTLTRERRIEDVNEQSDCGAERCTLCGALRDADDPDTYEFSFTLLIEGQDCVCLPVIFSGDDVETLLNGHHHDDHEDGSGDEDDDKDDDGRELVPCNLYLSENVGMLHRLRERLFLLWGNLEESFSTPAQSHHVSSSGKKAKRGGDHDRPATMWNEICLMEYWVNEAGGRAGWGGRRFKGFGMALV